MNIYIFINGSQSHSCVQYVFTLKWSIRFKVTTCVSSICDHFIVF